MGKKILVIDDEPDTVTLLSKRLSASGFDVCSALDPLEGFEKVKNELPDLVILDVLMPRMTGYDLVQEIKKASKDIAKTIPIIVISGRKSMKDFFNRWDIHSFHLKPFDSEQLMVSVRDALKLPLSEALFPEGAPAEASPAVTAAESAPPAKPAAAAPPAAKISSDAPPPKPGSKGKVLIVGIEDFIVDKLKGFFDKAGFQTDTTTEEEYAIRQAAAWKPDFIFCQFWEDPLTLDTRSIYKRLKNDGATKSIVFTAFCTATVAVEAMKLLEHGQVLPYSKSDELLKKIEAHLKSHGR